MPLKSNCNHIVFIMEGKQKKNTFRFENTSLRFTIVEHIVLRIIKAKYFADCPAFCERSWGMSHDYQLAVQHGSTMVRVGTTIFGPRVY